MDGRVKTLHPKLYAGLLAVRDNAEHLAAAEEHEVEFVDLVCVNLYPFERTAGQRGVTDDEVIENIDIGGPTMIRAAAKNYAYAAPVVDPESYDAVLDELRESDCRLSPDTRESLAAEAFAYTARYDTAIARWFQEKREDFPPLLVRAFEKVLELPYGENPHQRAAYYEQVGARTHVLSMVSQLGGKPLSFNNLLDLDAARLLLREFQIPACVIVKHNNPCGVAVRRDRARGLPAAPSPAIPMSAFGGVVCLNRRVDGELAEALAEQFVEVLFAPRLRRRGARGARREAQHCASSTTASGAPPNMIEPAPAPGRRRPAGPGPRRRPRGARRDAGRHRAPARPRPSGSELSFAWRCASTSSSNAIVLARDLATIGIGAGQMSRVDSVRLAIEKARDRRARARCWPPTPTSRSPTGPSSRSRPASPRSSSPAARSATTMTVEAVDRAGAAMVFTGRRHFRH